MKEIHENALCYIGRCNIAECQKAIREFATDKMAQELLMSRACQEFVIFSFGENAQISDNEFALITKTIQENKVRDFVVYVKTTAIPVLEYDHMRKDETPYRVIRNINPRVVARLETSEVQGLRDRWVEKEQRAIAD